ncbi:MAG: carboxyl transferase [Hungatella sp.]|nr:carboxyl transferase [Hungatella sp.]
MSNSAQSSASSRIHMLLDENSFVEVGAYVTARSTDFNMTDKETPADGVVTGYGTIDGCLVYVYSQDAAVLGGSMGEMHAKKISGIYGMAMKMGAPVIGLVDCAGLRLQEATDALHGFGELFYNQTMASGVIPQISAIFGTCGGGMAVSSAIADFTFMEGKKARLFVNSPNAIDDNHAGKCDTASADYQSEMAGTVDFVGDEAEIIAQIRSLISILPSNNEDDMSYEPCEDDLNRVCEGLENCAEDTGLALSGISDGNFFMEMKKEYAPSMVTGFIRLGGSTVGCVANRCAVYGEDGEKTAEYAPVLNAKGCRKAARFVKFCDAFNIPLLTLVNVTGYKADKCNEKTLAQSAAKLTYAFASASVPKVTVIVGQAYGTAYLTMASKSIGADIVYAWPSAAIGMMDAAAAAKIMYADEIRASEDGAGLIRERAAQYRELQSSALAAAKRGYVDDIIEAQDTRKRVIAALEMLFTKREDRPSKKHGTV